MSARILITGGSGFLGRAVALALRDEHEVILGARDNAVNEIAQRETGCATVPLDVANIESVRDVIVRHTPEVIIHAAATKYVQLSERFPHETIDVNVVGSQNVARVACERRVQTVVGVSTDKAAPPVKTTYGLSKAIMERIFCSADGIGETSFACARFGNIAWSTGSVLPEWRRMLDTRGVVGTTGPEMRRYMITVDEAAEIVVAAMTHIRTLAGSVLSRPMKAARIGDLLDAFIDVHGGSRERLPPRPADAEDEVLIGASEVPWTIEHAVGDRPHLVTRFNIAAAEPIPGSLSSANAVRLSPDELRAIILAEPR